MYSPQRYLLLELGPDDRSTYAECWGAHARSWGREIAAAHVLDDLRAAVDQIGHDNIRVVRRHGHGLKSIAGSRSEYHALTAK